MVRLYVSRSPLLRISIAVSLLFVFAVAAQAQPADITTPGDPIILVNGENDGDDFSGPPPAMEGVEHAIDNVGQKYLNFLDLGSGFIVTPTIGAVEGGTIVTGLRLYTANDAESRDPASYLLEGGLSPEGPFTPISSGALSLPSERNPGGNVPLDPLTSANQTVSFDNAVPYTSYRLTFPTLKDAADANSMQIAEVELLGVIIPEPGSLALFGIAAVGLLARRRLI